MSNQGSKSLTELERAYDNIECCLYLNEALKYKFLGRKEVLCPHTQMPEIFVTSGQELEKRQQGDQGSLALVKQFIHKCCWTHLGFNRILPLIKLRRKRWQGFFPIVLKKGQNETLEQRPQGRYKLGAKQVWLTLEVKFLVTLRLA